MSDRWMRDDYVDTLIELAEENPELVLLEADLMRASGTTRFRDRFPRRTFDVGVAEANMIGIASGLSAAGKIPFADSFAAFSSRRAYDQFYISANYAGLRVKLVGTDPGIAAEYNGGTHMSFEDIGLMRSIPKLTISEPCDPVSLRALLPQIARTPGCAYMRLHRKVAPVIYDETESFDLGRGKVLRDGKDLTIVFCGVMLAAEVLAAGNLLANEGIEATIIDMPTVKPLHADLIEEVARRTGAVLTCENHQISTGLGSATAEVLSERIPTPLRRIGVTDEFGEVGPVEYLKKRYGLTSSDICREAKNLLKLRL